MSMLLSSAPRVNVIWNSFLASLYGAIKKNGVGNNLLSTTHRWKKHPWHSHRVRFDHYAPRPVIVAFVRGQQAVHRDNRDISLSVDLIGLFAARKKWPFHIHSRAPVLLAWFRGCALYKACHNKTLPTNAPEWESRTSIILLFSHP